jgi:hypothetical protein
MYNPSLRQEPRYEPAAVIPPKKDASILDWLEARNRLIYRETEERDETSLEEDLEISELIDVDDHAYDDDMALGLDGESDTDDD